MAPIPASGPAQAGRLDPVTADRLAQLLSEVIHREYPHHLSLLARSDSDLRPPRELTPLFYGAFDWHSAVHSHWALVRLVRLHDELEWSAELRIALSGTFDDEEIEGEVDYARARPGFEVPYGAAWLLTLDAELAEGARTGDRQMTRWRDRLAPLVELAADRLVGWAEKLRYPIRTGEHSQSAFSMGLALDWARRTGHGAHLADVVAEQGRALYENDTGAPVAYEPSAWDFLSPALGEADLMRRILGPAELVRWLDRFLGPEDLARLEPVVPTDRTDGKLVHFDGLNFSRAWMMRGLAAALPERHPLAEPLARKADAHEAAGMSWLSGAHYVGSHWLGSFAVYALTDRGL